MLQGLHWILVHQKENKASGNQSYTLYNKSFVVFCCTDVDTCIIDKLQIVKMVSLQDLFIVFCKKGSSLLADRCTSQSDLEKLESTDCEYDSKAKDHKLDQIIIVKKIVESCSLPSNIFRESSLTHQL